MVTPMSIATAPTTDRPTAVRRTVLSRARLEHLPIDGHGAPIIRQQGRTVTNDRDDIIDLISSIAAVGVINPILCERHPDQTIWLVAGERRLRAARTLAEEQPGLHTITDGIPALVVPGPLTELDRRDWQLIENVARTDLQPTELARALLLDRCALLAQRLIDEHVELPDHVLSVPDPVDRFRALDQARIDAGAHHVGAPWEEVVERLGLELSKSRAQQFVRAFRDIPADITSEMDAERISLNSRLGWTRLAKHRSDLARDVWAGVTERGRPDLLPAAVAAALDDPDLDADTAIEKALQARTAANAARAAAHTANDDPGDVDVDDVTSELDEPDTPTPTAPPVDEHPTVHPTPVAPARPERPATPTAATDDEDTTDEDDVDLPDDFYDATHLIHELERATVSLRNGHTIDPRQARSLRGLTNTLIAQLQE